METVDGKIQNKDILCRYCLLMYPISILHIGNYMELNKIVDLTISFNLMRIECQPICASLRPPLRIFPLGGGLLPPEGTGVFWEGTSIGHLTSGYVILTNSASLQTSFYAR